MILSTYRTVGRKITKFFDFKMFLVTFVLYKMSSVFVCSTIITNLTWIVNRFKLW